jgi:light-regulated signal transduction histidine kinase (bacteriophytochrome)
MKRHAITTRFGTVAAIVAAGSFLLGACGGEMRAERQGRQLGQAVCDVTEADNVDDAERQLDQAQREMNDLQRIVGRPLDEDVDDIQGNLEDLVEHTVDGNDALREQDIAVIQRNIDAISRTLTGKAEAAYDGVQQGLAECDY